MSVVCPPRIAAGLVLALVACSSPSQPTPTPASLSRVTVIVTVRVINRNFGTAIPGDFRFSVTAGRPSVDSIATADGAGEGVDDDTAVVSVDANVPYAIKGSGGPEAYLETQSAACAGTLASGLAQCVITEIDTPITCDDNLWNTTYMAGRLKVLNPCQAASGIVRRVITEPDGDLFITIAPDAGSAGLLRPGNQQLNGQLAVEVPCQAPVTQANAMSMCSRASMKQIPVPAAGEHIAAAAHWVEDTNHFNWGELHGARIVRLPR